MIDASAEQSFRNTVEAPKFSSSSYKDRLLSLHNEIFRSELQDFDADKNKMGFGMAGAMDGVKVRYPRRTDKDALIEYAIEKANACKDPQHAALLLATAAVTIHPFGEGNGRISRALYCDLLGVPRIDESSKPRYDDAGLESRKLIDLGTAFVDNPLLSKLTKLHPYTITNTDNRGIRVVIHKPEKDGVEAITLSEEALSGFDTEEREDLVVSLGGDDKGNTYGKDQVGLTFATDLLMQRNRELEAYVKKLPDDRGEIVNIHELLPHMTVSQKKDFVSSLWLHRKLFAQASIDFLSDDFGSRQVTVGSEVTTFRDIVIQRTNNFQKSTGSF